LRRRPTVIRRHHIDDARGVVDAHHERIDALQRHQDHERERAAHRASPSRAGNPPRNARAVTLLRSSIGLPRLGFLEVGLKLGLDAHGELLSDCLTSVVEEGGSGALIGVR
jgi:hypothetical protein